MTYHTAVQAWNEHGNGDPTHFLNNGVDRHAYRIGNRVYKIDRSLFSYNRHSANIDEWKNYTAWSARIPENVGMALPETILHEIRAEDHGIEDCSIYVIEMEYIKGEFACLPSHLESLAADLGFDDYMENCIYSNGTYYLIDLA